MTVILRAALVISFLSAIGCGSGTTDVEGTVTFQRKPVVYGTVVLIGSDGLPKSGAIQPDGRYRIAGVRTGPAKIAVTSPTPPGVKVAGKKPKTGRDADERQPADADKAVSAEVAKAWFAIPDKYADHAQSGLTTEVKPGQPVDIDLK